MQSEGLPQWMRHRVHRTSSEYRDRSRRKPAIVLLLSLVFIVAVSAYAIAEHLEETYRILIVAGMFAGAVMLALAGLSPVQCSKKVLIVFVPSAIAIDTAICYLAGRTGDDTAAMITVNLTIIYTGLFLLLLLTRTRSVLSRQVKAAALLTPVTACVAGPALYLLGEGEWTLGQFVMYIILLSFSWVPLTLASFVVIIARHRSEITLPSDKWV
jgi:hypothetical protein